MLRFRDRQLHHLGILLLQHPLTLSDFLIKLGGAYLPKDVGKALLIDLKHLAAMRAFDLIHTEAP